MKKLNSKGLTLTELIVSFALVSVAVIYFYQTVSTVSELYYTAKKDTQEFTDRTYALKMIKEKYISDRDSITEDDLEGFCNKLGFDDCSVEIIDKNVKSYYCAYNKDKDKKGLCNEGICQSSFAGCSLDDYNAFDKIKITLNGKTSNILIPLDTHSYANKLNPQIIRQTRGNVRHPIGDDKYPNSWLLSINGKESNITSCYKIPYNLNNFGKLKLSFKLMNNHVGIKSNFKFYVENSCSIPNASTPLKGVVNEYVVSAEDVSKYLDHEIYLDVSDKRGKDNYLIIDISRNDTTEEQTTALLFENIEILK